MTAPVFFNARPAIERAFLLFFFNAMTDHIVGFKMDIFDNEWKPLLKLFSRAAMNDEIMADFSDEECDRLHTFMDALQDLALEKGK